MYPHERSLVKQLADKPFTIIGVNSDSDLDEIREIVKEKNLTWRSFQNEQDYGEISDLWGINGWPTIFLVDADGKIRYRDLRGSAMDAAIEELLKELGHDVKIIHEEEEAENNRKKKNTKSDDSAAASEADETEGAEKQKLMQRRMQIPATTATLKNRTNPQTSDPPTDGGPQRRNGRRPTERRGNYRGERVGSYRNKPI